MKKLILNTIAVCASLLATSQDVANITAAEYFIDTDPTIASGIVIDVGASGSTVSFTANIPSTGLSTGFHNVLIRVKDANNQWGLLESRAFYISATTNDANDIKAAEYFIDNDPGIGNGLPISINTPGAAIAFTIALPTTLLLPGFHTLFIRTKDTDNKWGPFESRAFYISSSTIDAVNIAAAEYFIDNDPGVGQGLPISITTPGAVIAFSALLPSTSLSPGFHSLYIRAKDAADTWGLFESRAFYISQSNNNATDIVAAEYFFDTDPGVGKGEPLVVNNPGATISQTFSITAPNGFSNGDHLLAIRVKGADGIWGLYEVGTVTNNTPLPVTGLSFVATRFNKQVLLNWSTFTEVNSNHFEIERSADGQTFNKISKVAAAGNSTLQKRYSFTDVQPNKSLNYYRLKQVDKNGLFTYSDIRQVNFDNAATYAAYPTVTRGAIQLAGIQEKTAVKIFTASGQFVKLFTISQSPATINLDMLATGTYLLVIEKDGALLYTQKIIKQ